MKQEDKELLLKDLCARLPYGLKVKCEKYSFPVTVFYVGNIDEVKFKETGGIECIYTIKPYLRLMSSMTEEEKDERRQIVTAVYDGEVIDDVFVNVVQYMDWLNAHYFDFHNLIEKELALEAPRGMYNLNK